MKTILHKILWFTSVFSLVCSCLGCTSSSNTPTNLLPEIAIFLEAHPQFGKAVDTEAVPDWANGQRQRVILNTDRKLLFYTKNGQVLTVYEDGPLGRDKVWGDYNY